MLVRCLWSIIRFIIVVGISVVIWILYLAEYAFCCQPSEILHFIMQAHLEIRRNVYL